MDTGAKLFFVSVEKLAVKSHLAGFADNKVTFIEFPVNRRAGSHDGADGSSRRSVSTIWMGIVLPYRSASVSLANLISSSVKSSVLLMVLPVPVIKRVYLNRYFHPSSSKHARI